MVKFIEEEVGVWVVYVGEEWKMKFYDQKGFEWGKRFIQQYYGVIV